MRDFFCLNDRIRFVFPIDGDCVTSRDGEERGGTLMLPVTVRADAGCTVAVNGIPAVASASEPTRYLAVVPVCGYRNTLVAENRMDGTSCRITVFRMPSADRQCYRVSSDDNIRFLKELTEGNYASIFDHPYLAVYKKAHDLYGAKVHLNLFYAFDDRARACFSEKHTYFDLSMMTDRYRDEFRRNADWLKLAFHAYSEFPDAPYKDADTETIRKDCIAVCREIVRFAGAECISDSTTVHWGEANPECVRALRALGFRSLTGYFELRSGDRPLVSYYAPPDLVRHVGARDFFVDTVEDMIFGRIDRVLNIGTLHEIRADIREIANDPHRGGFVSVMIHEQYFYGDYKRYLPDFAERVLSTCAYLAERGYAGSHITEAVTEPHLCVNSAFL